MARIKQAGTSVLIVTLIVGLVGYIGCRREQREQDVQVPTQETTTTNDGGVVEQDSPIMAGDKDDGRQGDKDDGQQADKDDGQQGDKDDGQQADKDDGRQGDKDDGQGQGNKDDGQQGDKDDGQQADKGDGQQGDKDDGQGQGNKDDGQQGDKDDMAQAAAPETVPVGNPGNNADSTGYGAVAYEYKIGKYEVTNAEYCEFLNAVAKKDRHQLYDLRMGGRDDRTGEAYGGITRKGWHGKFTYAVKPGAEKWPVNYVTFESAVRYVNWLSNGMGDGDTENGTYTLKWGEVKVPDHAALAAGEKVQWVIASENEWYKAAYYDPDKPGGAGYWIYPAKSDWQIDANLNSNTPTAIGTYSKAASAYGTFDQGGNVWEYNDNQSGDKVGLRGGSFFINDNENYMRSSTRYDVLGAKWPNYGFRVVALGGSEEAK